MAKRLILVGATLFCICLVLLIYRQVNRDLEGTLSEQPSPSALDVIIADSDDIEFLETGEGGLGKAEGFTFVKPGEYKINFAKRLSSEQGILELSYPRIQLYGSKKRIIEITAQSITMPAELSELESQLPNSGTLEGQVKIEIYRWVQSAGGKENKTSSGKGKQRLTEIIVEMDRVDFQREFSRVTSDGAVRIKANNFSAEGIGLTLQYDQVNDILQELELRQLGRLRMAVNIIDSTSEKSNQSDVATSGTGRREPTKSKKPRKDKTVTYRMTLSKDVVIDKGGEKLLAEAVEIKAHLNFSQSLEEEPLDGQPSSTMNPISAAQGETDTEFIEITCKGPLRIVTLPRDDSIPAELEKQIEFTAYGNPVQILRQGHPFVRADRIHYNNRDGKMKLLAGNTGAVWLSLGDEQFVTAESSINYDQHSGLARLFGPGRIQMSSQDSKASSVIEYQDQMIIKFADPTGDNDRETSTFASQVEWLEFSGGLRANNENSFFRAQQGRLTFYTDTRDAQEEAETDKSPMTSIKSIELAGNVKMTDPNNNFSCDSLTAQFERNDLNESQLAGIIAQGNVRGENDQYFIQADKKLQLIFDTASVPLAPYDQMDDQPAPQQPKRKSGVPDLARLISQRRVVYALAQGGGGKVHLINKKENYQVTGSMIEGRSDKGDIAKDGLWQITGNPAVVELARQGRLEGDRIDIDLKSGYCTAPGPGNMEVWSKIDLTGGDTSLEEPVPMQINWQQGALYSINSSEIVFQDVTAQIDLLGDNSRRHSELTCPTMKIMLTRSEDKDNVLNPDEKKNKRGLEHLIAQGPAVKLISHQYDIAGDNIISVMQMESQSLHFDYPAGLLKAKGEGWIELVNYQRTNDSEKITDDNKDANLSGVLSDSLGGDSPSYTLVHFLGQMDFDIDREIIHFTDQVALHRLTPIQKAKTLDSPLEFLDENGQIPWTKGTSRLHCDDLRLVRHEPTELDDSDKESARLDMGVLGYLHARGEVILEIAGSDDRRHFLAGNSLQYDNESNDIVITGSETKPVIFDQMRMERLRYNTKTGAINGYFGNLPTPGMIAN